MKIKRCGCFVLLLLAVSACMCFVSCDSGSGKTETLNTPTGLTVAGEVLEWNEVENAAGYVVKIDDKEYETVEPFLDIFEFTPLSESYTLFVRAFGDDDSPYGSSAWSDGISYRPVMANTDGLEYTLNIDERGYTVRAAKSAELKGRLIIPAYYRDLPVTVIGWTAFSLHSELTGVQMENSNIVTIETSAFLECTSLTHVILSEKTEEIKARAFEGCSALKALKLTSVVNKLGYYILNGCSNITSLSVDENNATFRSEGNCVINRETNKIVLGSNASVIPSSATAIAERAFYKRTGLTEITIPGNIETIDHSAFAYCSALRSVTIEEGVKNIHGRDLKTNSGEYGAFSYTALQSLHIPASVTNIWERIITGCNDLTSVTVDENNPVYRSESNCIMDNDDVLIAGCPASVIPQGTKKIGAFAFEELNITEIYIPDGVTEIGTQAFAFTTLTEVRLPNTLETIGNFSFFRAHLMHISIPNSVKTIEEFAFRGCKRMSTVLPSCVQTIEPGAFDFSTIYMDAYPVPPGWHKLPNEIYNPNEPDWYDYSNVVYNCSFGYDDGVSYVQTYTVREYPVKGSMYRPYTTQLMIPNTVPYRKGYIFTGWALQENGEVVYGTKNQHMSDYDRNLEIYYLSTPIMDITCEVDANTVLYAVWLKI